MYTSIMEISRRRGLISIPAAATVFDDGAYAGDAQIQDLQPGTERLISYAMDLDTEVAPTSKGEPTQLLSVGLVKGLLNVKNKYGETPLWASELVVQFMGGGTFQLNEE